MNLNVLVYNAIRTPDGTVLSSKHNYDYQRHRDKNGHVYSTDGGIGHRHGIKRMGNGEETNLNLMTFDDITKIREVFKYPVQDNDNGRPEFTFISLRYIPNMILDELIDSDLHPHWLRIIFLREKQYRNLELQQITLV